MADNLAVVFVAWFWRLLRSLAVFTKRRPNLPPSVSQPELEKGLYSTRRTDSSHRTGQTIRKHQDSIAAPPRSSSLASTQAPQFQFKFQPPESSFQEFLPHPSLRMKSSTSRRKRSRESTERRKQRRNGSVPQITPPPEIHIEDWSASDRKMDSRRRSLEATIVFPAPPGQHGIAHAVPSVIITPSTPSEENASRGFGLDPPISDTFAATQQSQDDSMTTIVDIVPSVDGETTDKVFDISPELGHPSNDSTTTGPQTARMFISAHDDTKISEEDPQRSLFTFTESLTEIAFGQHQLSAISPQDGDTSLDLPRSGINVFIMDPVFDPSANSTLRRDDADDRNRRVSQDSTVYESSMELSPAEERLSREGALPYPDVFDLDMYADLRASMAVFGIYTGEDVHTPTVLVPPSDVSVSPTLGAFTPSTTRPPTLTKFKFIAPISPPIGAVEESLAAVDPRNYAISSPPWTPDQARGRGELSGHFRFPSSQKSGLFSPNDAHPSVNTPKISSSSGYVINEIRRYRDHYRHPAYSRSPPLPVDQALSPSWSTSISEYSFPDRAVGSSSRSMPAVSESRDDAVAVSDTELGVKAAFEPTSAQETRGVHRVPLSRMPLNRRLLRDSNERLGLAAVTFASTEDVKAPTSIAASSKRRKTLRGDDSENLNPQAVGPTRTLVRRSNTVKTRLSASRGTTTGVKGRNVNLLKAVNRQEEQRKAGEYSIVESDYV